MKKRLKNKRKLVAEAFAGTKKEVPHISNKKECTTPSYEIKTPHQCRVCGKYFKSNKGLIIHCNSSKCYMTGNHIEALDCNFCGGGLQIPTDLAKEHTNAFHRHDHAYIPISLGIGEGGSGDVELAAEDDHQINEGLFEEEEGPTKKLARHVCDHTCPKSLSESEIHFLFRNRRCQRH